MSSFLTIPEKKWKKAIFQFDWEKWNKAIFKFERMEQFEFLRMKEIETRAISTAWIEIETKEFSQIAGKLKQGKFSQLQENWNKGNFHKLQENWNGWNLNLKEMWNRFACSQMETKLEMKWNFEKQKLKQLNFSQFETKIAWNNFSDRYPTAATNFVGLTLSTDV